MRSLFLFLLLFISVGVFAQELKFTVSKYDVFLNYYETNNGDLCDTFHYDANLLLTDNFSINEYVNGNHYPIFKGKFKEGKLIDSIFAFQNDGHLIMRGYCIESNIIDSVTYIVLANYTKYLFPGVKSGKFTYYHGWTGEKNRIENYTDGKLDGEEIRFEDGFVDRVFNYKNGLQQGKSYWNFYHSDIIEREWDYVNDTVIGYKEWYEKDSIKEIIEYSKGVQVSIKEFWSNGNLKRTNIHSESENHKKNAETEWHRNGQLFYIKNYENGKQEGKYEEYYPSGQIKIRSTYLNDSLEGKFESWHENGKIHEKGFFKRGNAQKGFKQYNENGQYMGDWSNHGNRHYWSYGSTGVIDGVYQKENITKYNFNYKPTLPVFIENTTFTNKEKRLLKKYPELTIELHLLHTDEVRFRIGFIENITITGKINEKHRNDLRLLIQNHLQISSPFKVGEKDADCVLHGILTFNRDQ